MLEGSPDALPSDCAAEGEGCDTEQFGHGGEGFFALLDLHGGVGHLRGGDRCAGFSRLLPMAV